VAVIGFRKQCALAGAAPRVLALLLAAGLSAHASAASAAEDGAQPPSGATPPVTAVPAAPVSPGPAAAPTPSPAPAATSAFPTQPPAASKPGFLNDFGRWWDQGIASFNAQMKDQQSKLEQFNKQSSEAAAATQQAMKDAADAMAHLSTPSKMIEVHEVCAVAGNGAADCASAAVKACKSQGFATGQPLDVRTAESCNASLWVSAQKPPSGECPVETMVLRAACQ